MVLTLSFITETKATKSLFRSVDNKMYQSTVNSKTLNRHCAASPFSFSDKNFPPWAFSSHF